MRRLLRSSAQNNEYGIEWLIMKKIFLFVSCVSVLALLMVGGGMFFFAQKNVKEQLEMQLNQERLSVEKWQKKFKKVEAEKEGLEKEADSLRDNVLHYLDINNGLQEETAKLQEGMKGLEKLQKAIDEKDLQIETLKKKAAAQKSGQKTKNDEHEKEMSTQVDTLNSELKSLGDTLIRERGIFHYNLGVAYTKAQLYTEALAAYKKSLEFEPGNYEAHYNLGVLYADVKWDRVSAAFHYRRYLELNPEAEDSEEVQKWVNQYARTPMSSQASEF